MRSIKEIGKLFFETRKKKNITIEEAYKRSRIHPKVLNNIESGQFEKIGKPYLKSFLKQYSAFLGLDTEKILEKYEAVSTSVPEKSFNLKKNEEKAKKEQLKQEKEELKKEGRENEKCKNEALPVFTEKKSSDEKIKLIFVAVLSAVLAILVFILFSTVRSKLSPGENKDKVKTSRQKEIAARKKSAKKEKTKKTDASEKKSSNEEEVSKPPAAPTVILGLKAR